MILLITDGARLAVDCVEGPVGASKNDRNDGPGQPPVGHIGDHGMGGQRNNNPGNLEDSAFTRNQPGYVGTDGRFAKFQTPTAGVRAHERLMTNHYFGAGINTIDGIVRKYAPSADGNDVGSYAKFLSSKTGIPACRPITDPADQRKVAAAMRMFESRYDKAEAPAIRVIARGAPKPGYRVMTPAQVAAHPGLDASRPYQVSGDGRISPIGAKPTARASTSSASKPRDARTLAAVIAPIFAKVEQGQPLTGGEQQALDLYKARGTRGRSCAAATGRGGPA